MSATSEKIRVLHVDDERDFGEMAAEFLQRQDQRFDVVTTTSASEALDQLPAGDFDCIVSDFDMPGQDGIQFLEAVREEHPDLPFILFTGKGSEEVASEAISSGVTDYLQKEAGTSQYEVLGNRIENAVEQQRTRAVVQETEQRLQTIAENSNDILWQFTHDWNELLFVNSSYEKIWGRSIDELRDRPQSFLEGIHPEDRDLVEQAMGELSAGESVDIEYRVNADEDFGRWVWVQGQPVFDDAGEVDKVVGFARDVTDRKEREREIEQLKDRFQAFTELSTDVISVVDQYGVIQYESPSAERVLGYTPDQLVGRTAFEHVHPEDRAGVLETFEGVVGSPGSRIERVEYRFEHADGSWVWLESVGSNRTNTAIDGHIITSRDITDRKDRERELEKRQADLRLYERAVESSTDLLAGIDTDGNLLFANERYRDYHGLTSDDALDVTLSELMRDAWESEVKARVERALAGQEVEYEMDRPGPDGDPRTLDIRYYPLWTEDGEIIGAVASMRDITDRSGPKNVPLDR